MTDSIRTAGIERRQSALTTNRVLRNTYLLLAMTLLFSAVTATVSVFMQMPPITGSHRFIAEISQKSRVELVRRGF